MYLERIQAICGKRNNNERKVNNVCASCLRSEVQNYLILVVERAISMLSRNLQFAVSAYLSHMADWVTQIGGRYWAAFTGWHIAIGGICSKNSTVD